MRPSSGFWADKTVLVTGFTGFKGAWLSFYLKNLGAKVFGIALPNTSEIAFSNSIDLIGLMDGVHLVDLREQKKIKAVVRDIDPHIVFHMAAMSTVGDCFRNRANAFEVNSMGVVYLLEALLEAPNLSSIINITSDKSYKNFEDGRRYREEDRLGGSDIYSSTKACSELITYAYAQSVYLPRGVGVATARAGNVIGNGDHNLSRIFPGILNTIGENNSVLTVRSPRSIRPWQHVLDSLRGYLMLAEALSASATNFSSAWNFGPSDSSAATVKNLLDLVSQENPMFKWVEDSRENQDVPEYHTLCLDSSRALKDLGWRCLWDLETAVVESLRFQEHLYKDVKTARAMAWSLVEKHHGLR